jgi:hypothetical protein
MSDQMLPDWQKLREMLIAFSGKIETIEKLQELKGETFNIFSVLKMERLEVETHSAFIYELINPKGLHCQGNKYLDVFIKYVLGINDFDLTRAHVGREEMTHDGRRIDLTIKNEEYFVVIEMKIDAGDQSQQLVDYKRYADRQGVKTKLYYLTLNGKDASDESTTNSKKEKVDYNKLSFSYHILNWIEACIEKSALLPTIRETLFQYAHLIRKMTGQTTMEISMQVVEMINNPKMAQAATEMAQNLGYVWAIKEIKFWNRLWDEMLEKVRGLGWEIHGYDIMYQDDNWIDDEKELAEKIAQARAAKDEEVGLVCKKTFDSIAIEVYIYQFNSTGLKYYLIASKYKDIDKIGQTISMTKKHGDNRHGDSKINVKFYGKGVTNPSYELFDDEALEGFVQSVAKEALKKLETINNLLSKVGKII